MKTNGKHDDRTRPSVRRSSATRSRGSHGDERSAHPLVSFQRERGNQAVQRLLGAYGTPMAVTPANDRHERAAERVARSVRRPPEQSVPEQESDPTRHGLGRGTTDVGAREGPRSPTGAGHTLDESTRSFFESRLGTDLADVRVHTDRRADAAARELNATAFTVGTDIGFRSGAYRPNSPAGTRLLAHELAHVVQQRTGTVSSRGVAAVAQLQRGPFGGGGSIVEPDVGSLTFRLREDGRIEIVLGGPNVVGGSPAVGARRTPDGNWVPVVGGNPVTEPEQTYSWEEVLELVRPKLGGTVSGPIPPVFPPPGATPGSTAGPSATSPVSSQRPAADFPQLTLTEPELRFTGFERVVVDSFAFDDHAVPSRHESTLASVALRLRADQVPHVIVDGHTDTTGREGYNRALGQRRADAVKAALVDHGVEASRIETRSAGETDPATTPERTSTDRARNRRVEIFWLRPRANRGPSLNVPGLRLDPLDETQ